MIAISFFSYKGGVGRTMAITNIASKLVEFGKSVFIIDFDLEAPGVPFKLKNYLNVSEIQHGIVDYIYNFSEKGHIDDITKYTITLPQNNPDDAAMWLLPAGNSDMDAYWNKLSRINWHDMFYREGGKGLRFFLDLKQKIKKQFNPDYLLIDSRTGITELSGISIKILADEVVLLLANNEENQAGTEKVLRFLMSKNDIKRSPKIHLVLTRIENPENDRAKFNKEYKLLDSLKKRYSSIIGKDDIDISVIHTDDDLQMDEGLAFSEQEKGIHSEHMNLFEHIFKEKFSPDEWTKKQIQSQAVKQYTKALQTNNRIAKIALLTEAINLDSQRWIYFYVRGYEYLNEGRIVEAEQDLKKALELSSSTHAKYLLAICYSSNNKLEDALSLVNDLISMEKAIPDFIWLKGNVLTQLHREKEALDLYNEGLKRFPDSHLLLNSRADLFRRLKMYSEAFRDISKAIEKEQLPVYLGTLAEIYLAQGRIDEFYVTLSTALSKGLNIKEMRTAMDAYIQVKEDLRFKEILRSFNMNSQDIFHNGPIEDSISN